MGAGDLSKRAIIGGLIIKNHSHAFEVFFLWAAALVTLICILSVVVKMKINKVLMLGVYVHVRNRKSAYNNSEVLH